jgi:hypothetical protein
LSRKKKAIFLLLIIFISQNVVRAQSTSLEVFPKFAQPGDKVLINIQSIPREEIDLILSFNGNLNVTDNEFIYTMESLEIPQNIKVFQIEAENVALLRFAVIINEVPVTQTIQGMEGYATISGKNILPGKYWVQISGIPSIGYDEVKFNVTARINIITDNQGEYTLTYDTTGFPSGVLTVKADSIMTQVVLENRKYEPPKRYNLVIEPFSIPEKFIQGKELELIYKVTSLEDDVPGFLVHFRVENEILDQEKIHNISVNEAILYNVLWTPESSGLKVIQAVVDPTNLIDETEELDNISQQMIKVEKNKNIIIYLVVSLPIAILIYFFSRFLIRKT